VDWVDDPDSRVRIVRTAVEDLSGVARLMADSSVVRFLGVGVVSTLAYAALYLALRGPLGAEGSNLAALAATGLGNTAANRRVTFGVRGRGGLVWHYVGGAVVFVLAVVLTSGALAVVPDSGRAVELGVLVVASLAATVLRYVALRGWVFGARWRGRRTAGL
jgi:putative flippase GtrA